MMDKGDNNLALEKLRESWDICENDSQRAKTLKLVGCRDYAGDGRSRYAEIPLEEGPEELSQFTQDGSKKQGHQKGNE